LMNFYALMGLDHTSDTTCMVYVSKSPLLDSGCLGVKIVDMVVPYSARVVWYQNTMVLSFTEFR